MPLRLHLRPAVRKDLNTLVAFSAAMAAETESLTLDRRRLRRGLSSILTTPGRGLFRVAEVQLGGSRRVIGQMMITYEWSDWRNGAFWWIQSVYVDPAWRRQGVYRTMHDAIRREARATPGVCGLRLYVEHGNRAAQRTYRRMGMVTAPYRVFEDDFIIRPTSSPRRRAHARRTVRATGGQK